MWLALALAASSMNAATPSRGAGAVVCMEVTGSAGFEANDVADLERAIRAASRRLRVKSRIEASGQCQEPPTLQLTVARFGSNVQVVARLRSGPNSGVVEWTEPLVRALQSATLANHLRALLTPYRRPRTASRTAPAGDEEPEASPPTPPDTPLDTDGDATETTPGDTNDPTESVGENVGAESSPTTTVVAAAPAESPTEARIETSPSAAAPADAMIFGVSVIPAGARATSAPHIERFEPWGGSITAGLTAEFPLSNGWDSRAAGAVEGTWVLFSRTDGGVGSAGSLLVGASLLPLRWKAAMPRIDLRVGAAVTGKLLRFTWQGGLGIDFEVEALRIGPSLRFMQIVDLPPVGTRRADLHAWLFGLAVAWLNDR